MMSEAQARAVLAYLASRKGGPGVAERARIHASLLSRLFPEQRAFVVSKAKQRLARCGRRAGKTTGVATALALTATAEAGNQCAYIALTRDNAKNLMLPELERLAEFHRIPIQVNRSDLVVSLGEGPTGTVFLRGADNERSVDKLRSFHFELIALDEMAFYGLHIHRLIDSLEATMMDRQGQMVAISSPGYVCAGKFFDLDQPTSGWERHHWTVLDNPHIPHAGMWLDEIREKRGWQADHPTYLREYLGQWVDDARSLCFPFAPGLNLYDSLPEGPVWQHVLGIDVGYAPDPSAFVVLAYSATCRTAYVVHSERHERWIPSQVWAQAERLAMRYHVESVALDATKGQIEELARRFKMPVALPSKAGKAMHIAHMADDMRQGYLKVRSSDETLIHEMRTVAWNAKRTGPDPRLPNDLTDALQYAWTNCSHHSARPAPAPLSAEDRLNAEVEAMQRAAERGAIEGDGLVEDDVDLGMGL